MVKKIALVLTLCAGFTLTACYVPPDDLTGSQEALPVGNSSIPFATVQPTASPTPIVTEPPVPTDTPVPASLTLPPASGGSDWTPSTAVPDSSQTWTPATTRPVATAEVPAGYSPVTPPPQAQVTATNTPQSLQNGARGDEVKTLQRRLKELGYYTGSIDGVFGDGTEQAVKAFQQASGLTADGKVGRQTSGSLFSSNAKRANNVNYTAATPRAAVTPRPTATPRTDLYLSLGSKGNAVTRLQNRLIELGYLSGTADSVFAGATEMAVRAFQRRSSLWVDGKAGPDTLTAIYQQNARSAATLAASTGITLKEGAVGSDVRCMQNRLRDLGYLTSSADGTYGAMTTDAVMRFQSANSLQVDGTAGSATLNALYASSAIAASAAAQPQYTYQETYETEVGFEPAATAVIYTESVPLNTATIEQNADNDPESIRAVQTRLKELGFYTGRVDGVFGNDTVSAVIAFQMSRNLTADGKVGKRTQAALFAENAASPAYKTLKNGSKGTEVSNLQYTLYELGYYTGAVDGIYGDSTAKAVSEFQSNNGLAVTGVADSATLAIVFSSSAVPSQQMNTGKQYTTLRLGDRGEDVLEMKDVLIQLGYLSGSDDSNEFTADTENAVRLFQSRNRLTVDGVAGPATLRRLYSENPVAND